MLWGLYTTAALLTLLWLLLAAWSLFADRSRARRRCPKCFFSLEGLDTLRCPECGRTAASERHLHRTRRRWGVLITSAILLLSPAAAAAWLARVQQVGAWGDVPTGVLIRLLWTGDDRITDEVIARIKRYETGWDDADLVARRAAADLATATRRERGYLLLEALARNSYANTFDDRKPMLEELSPDRTMPALLDRFGAGDAAERARVMALFSHLRDADERANLLILAHLADDQDPHLARVARQALGNQWRQSKSVTRRPWTPSVLGEYPARSDHAAPTDAPELVWFSKQIQARGLERPAVLDLARQLATGDLPSPVPGGTGVVLRAAGLWLWCRLGPEEPACLDALDAAAASDHPVLRTTAIQQLTAFPWSDRTEAILRRALDDPDPASGVQFYATQVIQRLGPAAAPLIPDMLELARRPTRGASSAFPEEFMAAGGRPDDLLAAILDRLTIVRDRLENPTPDTGPIDPGFDFLWIADLGMQSTEGAATVRWFLDNRIDERDPMFAYSVPHGALAYAVLTGDREYPTRIIFDRNPDFSDGASFGAWPDVLTDLCRRDLADPDLVVEHLVTGADTTRRDAFLSIMQFLKHDRLAPYEAALRRLAEDENAQIAAGAAAQLKRLK
jgi:hypothetical protein